MISKHIFFKKSQIDFLDNLNELSVSEHIRRAVDQYIDKFRPVEASASLSKKKEGDNNG